MRNSTHILGRVVEHMPYYDGPYYISTLIKKLIDGGHGETIFDCYHIEGAIINAKWQGERASAWLDRSIVEYLINLFLDLLFLEVGRLYINRFNIGDDVDGMIS